MTFRKTVKSSKKCEIFPYLSANHVVHHSFMYRRQQISGSETKAFLLTAQWVMWTSADLPQLSLLSSPTGVPWWNQRHLHTQWVALQEKNPWPTAKSFFLNVDYFLKVFIEFVTVLLLFYVLVLGPPGIMVLAPQPGMESTPPALEGKILTPGPPGKSQVQNFLIKKQMIQQAENKDILNEF